MTDTYQYYCPKGMEKYGDDGLSAGAIAGISVGCVVAVAIIVFCIVFFVVRKKKSNGRTGIDQDEVYTNQTV